MAPHPPLPGGAPQTQPPQPQDEALEFAGKETAPTAEAAVREMARYAKVAVVTLGERGSVYCSGDLDPVSVPAVGSIKILDTTGAGDLFTAGFTYGIMKGHPLPACAKLATLAGAAACQSVGAEVTEESWTWFHAQLHGERAGSAVRESVDTVRPLRLHGFHSSRRG